jgi:GT2 family glycosyltransferase
MKRVLIATPCLYGKVDAYYVHSLCESIKLGLKQDLAINAIFLANESILPMARNELINLAYQQEYDAMVFIDDDEYWDPKALIDIILSPKDVVCLPVVNKGDKKIEYNVFLDDKVEKDTDGYIKTKKVGTGFMKLSKKAIVDLWESNPEILFRNKKLKLICDYGFQNDSFIGEDILLCKKLMEMGYTIWVNPAHTVAHMGPKMYKGDFEKDLNEKHSIL